MWIAGIVQAQAQAKGTKTKSLWKQHQLAEQACKTAWLVHTILQPADHSGALTLVRRHKARVSYKIPAGEGVPRGGGLPIFPSEQYPITAKPNTAMLWWDRNQLPSIQTGALWHNQPGATNWQLCKKLFQHLSWLTWVQDIKPRSLKEYTDGWLKAWESTSSSLLGSIHFGHYMASTFNPDIVIFNMTIADLPMKMGYLPSRWQEGLNVMLEKIQCGKIVDHTAIWGRFQCQQQVAWKSSHDECRNSQPVSRWTIW